MTLGPKQRWALVPVVAIGGCTGTTTLGGAVGNLLQTMMTPASLESTLPTDVRYGLVNAAGAIAFVVLGAWMAPRYRAAVAAILYAAGARIAWLALDSWWFPEGHPRAYQPSDVPLALTLAGGLLGVLISLIAFRRAPANEPEPSRSSSTTKSATV
jgi:hypothetical protein